MKHASETGSKITGKGLWKMRPQSGVGEWMCHGTRGLLDSGGGEGSRLTGVWMDNHLGGGGESGRKGPLSGESVASLGS